MTFAECGAVVSPHTQVDTSPLSSSCHKLEDHIDPHSAHSYSELCVMSLRTWHNLATQVLAS